MLACATAPDRQRGVEAVKNAGRADPVYLVGFFAGDRAKLTDDGIRELVKLQDPSFDLEETCGLFGGRKPAPHFGYGGRYFTGIFGIQGVIDSPLCNRRPSLTDDRMARYVSGEMRVNCAISK